MGTPESFVLNYRNQVVLRIPQQQLEAKTLLGLHRNLQKAEQPLGQVPGSVQLLWVLLSVVPG